MDELITEYPNPTQEVKLFVGSDGVIFAHLSNGEIRTVEVDVPFAGYYGILRIGDRKKEEG